MLEMLLRHIEHSTRASGFGLAVWLECMWRPAFFVSAVLCCLCCGHPVQSKGCSLGAGWCSPMHSACLKCVSRLISACQPGDQRLSSSRLAPTKTPDQGLPVQCFHTGTLPSLLPTNMISNTWPLNTSQQPCQTKCQTEEEAGLP